ncbi:AraC family transcriptional regulator [Variovorax sp. J31P207]|uniref:AraC family transcriptional regulator n=1 Tax=Variovorax sp. J31P207 TaxID=3053510 RepID=UPI00257576FC|nr:AraC family transcriptional regulator [Variovorax sp. J31P207]MDM0065065.1 helix-turn-helix transcriptional regulator [Variovorax sp. J31P207]
MPFKTYPQPSRDSSAAGWTLGPIGIIRSDLAALEPSPVEDIDPGQGDCVYFKLITSGYVLVEQGSRLHRFDAGSMFALDPAEAFIESVPEQSSIIALRIPKHLLQARGWKSSLGGLISPDMHPSDAAAIGDLVACIANQSNLPNPDMRSWLGDQLLHIVDVVLAAARNLSARRSPKELIFRAKSHIRQNLGQEDLDASSVGAALNISAKHLQRLFRSQGTSVMRHVWQVRLEHAHTLLRTGASDATSVQGIAWQCGFSTAAHFSRVFKQRFGVSPRSVMLASAA